MDAHEIETAAPVGSEDELLAEHDARKAELVKLRYFIGLSIEEAAEVLQISAVSAKRDWTYACTWLFRVISQAL